jgi:hypothetical protein
MGAITSYDKLEELGRTRLSTNFFLREFLHSEIAAWHGLKNLPDHPERAIAVGKKLCEELLEPLQSQFGRIHVRSGYRSPAVNEFGNKNKLNCASNEANYAGHIWDYPDPNGKVGASACIVLPSLVDHIARGGSWTDMAWWIHDHLPYSSLYFFPKLAAFNINWHEVPARRIDSYVQPKGCLTKQGMPNHAGSHEDEYRGLPKAAVGGPPSSGLFTGGDLPKYEVEPRVTTCEDKAKPERVLRPQATPEASAPKTSAGAIHYRAIHTKTLWRKAHNHRSLGAAINGKDGAAGLFAGTVRIDYGVHGQPLYVVVWEEGSAVGFVIKPDARSPNGIQQASAPISVIMKFERDGHGNKREIEQLFLT